MRVIAGLVSCLVLLMLWPVAWGQPVGQDSFDDWLDKVRQEAKLVALGAVVVDVRGDVKAVGVSGHRVKGRSAAVQPEDAWHIGSCTKMLTAALYADLVSQGEAQWGATLPELLPDLAETMDPAWRAVTIEDLLAHRSGLQANPAMVWFTTARFSNAGPADQRTDVAASYLSRPPSAPQGEFLYSNLGYMMAGAAIDRIAARLGKDDYESLFLNAFVTPEEGWGFGPPQDGIEGHARNLFGMLRPRGSSQSADNPVALAPAGTLHVPLVPHAKFVSRFLASNPMNAHLLTAYPDAESDYALGWGVYETEAFGRVFRHTGSNGLWFCMVTLVPEAGLVIIVNTNQYSNRVGEALESATLELARMQAPSQD